MYAATRANHTIVRQLLRAGASLGFRDVDGDTALAVAQRFGHAECVRAIEEHVKAVAREPREAASGGESAKGGEEPAAAPSDESGASLPERVAKASIKGDVATVASWLDGGGDVNATIDVPGGSFQGYTMLMLASTAGKEAVVELLLARGAKLDLQTSDGFTALMNAAYTGKHTICLLYTSPSPRDS